MLRILQFLESLMTNFLTLEFIRLAWQSGLNLIKFLVSNHGNHETVKRIYNTLIGSLLVYSFFSVARIAAINLEKLQRVKIKYLLSQLEVGLQTPGVVNNANVCLLLEEHPDSVSCIRRDEKDTPLYLFHSSE